jgi:predicted TIM-barrel fold metal-dependent hydrolase
MDAAGVDIQLINQGNGINPDRFPAEQAVALVRRVNDLIAERIEPYPDRLLGSVAITFKDVEASVGELQRMAKRGFRAVLLYARGEQIGCPESEPLFAMISELGLPIFLHGAGGSYAPPPGLDLLEDNGRAVSGVYGDAAVADFVVRMIAAGLFDRYPNLQVVIRTGGGSIPALLHRLRQTHKGLKGERPYRDVLLDHFLVDTANIDSHALPFLVDVMGEDRVVFGSDYCGGTGPLRDAVAVVDAQPDPQAVRALTQRNSQRLLRL